MRPAPRGKSQIHMLYQAAAWLGVIRVNLTLAFTPVSPRPPRRPAITQHLTPYQASAFMLSFWVVSIPTRIVRARPCLRVLNGVTFPTTERVAFNLHPVASFQQRQIRTKPSSC